MNAQQIIGRNLRKHRLRLGLSQEELAFLTNLQQSCISSLERGIRNPTVLVLERLAKALKVKPHELLMG